MGPLGPRRPTRLAVLARPVRAPPAEVLLARQFIPYGRTPVPGAAPRAVAGPPPRAAAGLSRVDGRPRSVLGRARPPGRARGRCRSERPLSAGGLSCARTAKAAGRN